ncbi:MAG TPA: UDPGP type 1 family protein [Fibrobacteria bacterium]|nr:UDPGP type 1 family protein [Fibrobacteria bacterium]
MPDKTRLEEARQAAARHGQTHLFRFYDGLDPVGRDALVDQILSVDFDQIARLHADLVKNQGASAPPERIEPLRTKAWEAFSLGERAALANQGMRALREGKVAAFLVAGGQGTRLGHDGPKGAFDIGLPSRKSLFQLQAERILRLSRQAGKTIPWYIMTSGENHAETTGFFKDRRFFGLSERDVFFFKQGEMPVVDAEGKILLAAKGRLSMGPNGNGGCFPALAKSGALADMKRRGIEHVFFYSVDNALVRVCDPHFVGFAMHEGMPAASKAVVKARPEEKVGVLCLRDGKPSVIEYSEMTEEMIHSKTADGRYLYDSANVAMHLFTRAFLEAYAGASLPFHPAHKKIAYVAPSGETITPAAPNAYKFELFMFDLFPMAGSMAGLLVRREEEFAPVKNKDGVDSPASARALLLELHHKWAVAAGVGEEELKGKLVEISPLASYGGEGINTALIRSQLGNPIVHVS